MDDIDRAAEAMERAAENQRQVMLSRAARPAHLYDVCRNCGEPLYQEDLRRGGFCNVECRDEHDLRARMAAITGRKPS
jgi:acetyl-CoA carboxylase beta subunit